MDNNSTRSGIIFVDADATPRDALATVDRLADQFSLQVVTISSINHHHDRKNHILVDAHPQAVDMEIIKRLSRDVPAIVVTGDYGLAALALGKGAHAVSPRGMIYTNDNIDRLLLERDLHARERRATGRNRGPKARTADDAARFERALREVIAHLS